MLPLTWNFLVQLLKKELLMVEVWIKREENQPQGIMLYLCLLFLSFLVHVHNIEVKGVSCFLIFFHRVVYRPKQINMSEGDADKNSTFTRLANCLSFARMKGINRNKR